MQPRLRPGLALAHRGPPTPSVLIVAPAAALTARSSVRYSWRRARRVRCALAESAGRPVDLVVLNRAPVDLIHRVLRDGILLLDRDPAARIRFEVRSRADYFDLLPHLRRYRRIAPEPSP